MAKISLARLDVAALLKLRDDIGVALSRKADELKGQLAKLGGDVIGKGRRRRRASPMKGRKAPIKYRDKSGNVWAGRGAQPRWLTAAIKAGAKRDDFLVSKPAKKTRKVKRRKSRWVM